MYTVPELHAKYPRIPVWTIRYACRNGQINGARLAGRVWLIPRAAADEWAESYTRYGSLTKEGRARPATGPSVGPRSHHQP